MKTINHEYYVSLEVGKLLQKAGFDWELETCYIGKSVRPYKYHKFFNWNKPRKDFEKDGSDNLFHAFITQKKTNSFISAPTLEVAQRWLREVRNFDVLILFQWRGDRSIAYKYEIRLEGRPYALQLLLFNTYEEAQEAGIKKALELILEKEE